MKEAQWRINAINKRHGSDNEFQAALHGRELSSKSSPKVYNELSEEEENAIQEAAQRRMNGR